MNAPLLHIDHLTKKFPNSFDALNDLSLSLEKGDIFGIVGSSGAGKSTLMRCLTGLEKPTTGKIWFDGVDLTGASALSLKNMRQKMGKIFQHFHLLSSRTALENVLFPLEIRGEKKSKKGLELLSLVGLEEKAHLYPSQLSGGEKQRVAIARAIATQPTLLLSDEATSALDPQTTGSILALLLQLNREFGLTILLITHQMEVIKEICTKVAVLEKGRIVEMGDVTSLFARPSHPMTKKMLQGISHPLPPTLLQPKEGKMVIRLTFTGKSAKEPIISRLIKQFDVEVNILFGGIDVLQTGVVGNLVVELTGAFDEIVRARLYLEKYGVLCEVLT